MNLSEEQRSKIIGFIKNLCVTNTSHLKIREDDSFKGLGLDSLDIIQLTLDIEEEFNVVLNDSAIERVDTVEDLLTLVSNTLE